ncbi:hypothetical protein RvY_02386 [Ramazzottius varieornatus]|uniref:Phosphatidylinositol-glycan biosynthesis class F protein n=1 Tax=Ramazzottius varieornatus TaxID=947166 RepID=A0A1D1UUN6_RAMVA|nr:hypothetical protein RvY_02386 [Ramazzottius varieornatus]
MKKRLDIEKIAISGGKVLLSSTALLPGLVGYGKLTMDIVQNPQDTTLYLTAAVFLLDLCTFRYLYLDDLQPRKTQALFRTPGWNFPTAALFMLASVLLFFVGIILFGAPILDSSMETLTLAMLLATTAFLPFCYVYAQPVDELLKVLQTEKLDLSMEKAPLFPGMLAVVGAWCGAVVIPLDWDRPWQAWPIPCCYGAFAGYAVGHLLFISASITRSLPRRYSAVRHQQSATSKAE